MVVDGDPAQAARAIARAARGAACFALSQDFGSWRVVAREDAWQVDVEPLRGGTIEADLALRDFTVNAIAEPIAGGAPIDPLGGAADLRARRLRMAGARRLRAPTRCACCGSCASRSSWSWSPTPTRCAPRARSRARAWSGLGRARVRGAAADHRRARGTPGSRADGPLGATAVVLPELEALRGVEQSRFHHLDVYGHTLEVLDRVVELTTGTSATGDADATGAEATRADAELDACIAPHRAEIELLLAEPLADEMTRGEALRWGALLHDAAKPLTREVRPEDGRVTFIGHDVRGRRARPRGARAPAHQ